MKWFLAAALFSLATCGALVGKGAAAQDTASLLGTGFAFHGDGHVAMIVGSGHDRPDADRKLIVFADGANRQLDVVAPVHARWRTPEELIVEEFVNYTDRPPGRRVVRIARDGTRLGTLIEGGGLSNSEPSPDGSRLLVERFDARGSQGLEVRRLESSLPLERSCPCMADTYCSVHHGVWSPDGARFAVALRLGASSGVVYPHIAIASLTEPGYRLLRRNLDPSQARHGEEPLYWNREGLYARVGRGLARCEVDGGTCVQVYEAADGKALRSGAGAGPGKALLLIRDVAADPYEARAKEVLEVDLATGKARVALQLPPDRFISDIDWIDDRK